MIKIQSGTPADVEAVAAFLTVNGLRSEVLAGINAEAPGALFTIASVGGSVVGFARGSQAREARGTGAWVRRRFHVNTVIVEPSFRGARVGQALVQQLLADAYGRGFRTAQLWAHTDNAAALVLYTKLGFVPAGNSVVDERLGSIQQMAADLKP